MVRQKVLWRPLKAFVKPFEAPQRRVKIKIEVNFLSFSGIRMGKVNRLLTLKLLKHLLLASYLIPAQNIDKNQVYGIAMAWLAEPVLENIFVTNWEMGSCFDLNATCCSFIKRDSNTGAFLWNLRNFLRIRSGGCFYNDTTFCDIESR